jgi:2-oxoglutarate ferredoxin oxidoreductase subunit gamma
MACSTRKDMGVKQVRFCGFGGQGVVLAGTILGYAAVKDALWAAGSSSYGAQARGGYARSDVVISDGPIVYPHVIEADVLVAMSQSAYEQYRKEMATDGMIIFDEEMVAPVPVEGIRQVGVAATAAALKELKSKQTANMVILGASTALAGMVSRGALEAAIGENVSERFRELNLRAIEVGFRLGEATK